MIGKGCYSFIQYRKEIDPIETENEILEKIFKGEEDDIYKTSVALELEEAYLKKKLRKLSLIESEDNFTPSINADNI